ncbi:30S ribosomal protein S4 [Candidatus Omnitrophota bacterium]
MARYTGPSCRLCRREATKLFLKGKKCYAGNCIVLKRPTPPGQHGQQRIKSSNYALQLREKQKAKRTYGILERQFRRYFKKAATAKGVTGEILLQTLERRLDNVVFSLHFATSRTEARQIVRHGHILVNERKVNIPSYLIHANDRIAIKPNEKNSKRFKDTIEFCKERTLPAWLELDENNLKGTVLRFPNRGDVQFPIQEQLIVELYSK